MDSWHIRFGRLLILLQIDAGSPEFFVSYVATPGVVLTLEINFTTQTVKGYKGEECLIEFKGDEN